MAQWLVKEEPEHYSYDQLVKDRKTVWAGVKNPLAQKHLRSIRKGDRIFYYHTGKEKAIVAIASATSDAYPDPEGRDAEGVRRGRGAGEEAAAAGDARRSQSRPRVRDFPLVRMSRLSVMPVTDDEWARIEEDEPVMNVRRPERPRSQRVARGDLRAPTPARELLQRFLERQRHLLRIPAAGEPGPHRLAPHQLDAETREAQRARPLQRRILVVVPEPVARFLFPAAGTEQRPARLHSRGGTSPKRCHPFVVQRELLNLLSACAIPHVPPDTPTVSRGCDRPGHEPEQKWKSGRSGKVEK